MSTAVLSFFIVYSYIVWMCIVIISFWNAYRIYMYICLNVTISYIEDLIANKITVIVCILYIDVLS